MEQTSLREPSRRVDKMTSATDAKIAFAFDRNAGGGIGCVSRHQSYVKKMPKRKPDEMMLQELQRAIEVNAPARLRPLIEAGVSVDQKIGDFPRKTLLEFAVERDAVEVVKFLIAAGAKLDKGLHKPLIEAAFLNRAEIVRLLLQAGADPNITACEPEVTGLTARLRQNPQARTPASRPRSVLRLQSAADVEWQDGVDNFELTDLIIHCSMFAQIGRQIRDLPEGATIDRITTTNDDG